MGVCLLLDEDVPILLAQVLRDRGHDVVHVTELGLSGAPDQVVFQRAIDAGRTVLTHNVADFLVLTQDLADEGEAHTGLLLSPQLPFSDLLRRTLRTLRDRDVSDLVSAVVWLE